MLNGWARPTRSRGECKIVGAISAICPRCDISRRYDIFCCPTEVRATIRQGYTLGTRIGSADKKTSGAIGTTAPLVVQQRRRPGQAMSRQEQVDALIWARERARTIGESLFTGRACTTCHAVTPGRQAGDPWMIAPVRVAGIWYAKSQFTHARHTTMQCAQCHDARASNTATDLLIPGIANCRQCHGGEAASTKVPTTCVACHGYHEHDALILAELQARTKPPPDPK